MLVITHILRTIKCSKIIEGWMNEGDDDYIYYKKDYGRGENSCRKDKRPVKLKCEKRLFATLWGYDGEAGSCLWVSDGE